MLSGATWSAAEMAGTAVFRIVVSSDSMKNATATNHGRRRLLAAAGWGVKGTALEVLIEFISFPWSLRQPDAALEINKARVGVEAIQTRVRGQINCREIRPFLEGSIQPRQNLVLFPQARINDCPAVRRDVVVHRQLVEMAQHLLRFTLVPRQRIGMAQ